MSETIFNGTSTVIKENVAFYGGGISAVRSSVILLSEYICFTHNKGGAVLILNSLDLEVLLSGCFINNTGSNNNVDGVISLRLAQVTFTNVSIINSFQFPNFFNNFC